MPYGTKFLQEDYFGPSTQAIQKLRDVIIQEEKKTNNEYIFIFVAVGITILTHKCKYFLRVPRARATIKRPQNKKGINFFE